MTTFGNRFLARTDRFWELGRKRFGTGSVALRCPGGPYLVGGLSRSQLELTERHFGGFLEEAGALPSDAVELELLRVPPDVFRHDQERPFEYEMDLDFSAAEVRLAGLDLFARLRLEGGAAASLWTAAEDARFPGVLENCLRTLVAYRVVELGGVLLHSAGIVDGSEAFLFYGHSGAGKTTSARHSLSTGRRVLSDDLNVVLPGLKRPLAAQVPFAGDLREQGRGVDALPIRALCRLQKAPAHRVRPDRRAVAVAALIACTPAVNQDPYRREKLSANVEALTAAVPCLLLELAPDPGFWTLLESV